MVRGREMREREREKLKMRSGENWKFCVLTTEDRASLNSKKWNIK